MFLKNHSSLKKISGFSLIEMMLVVAIGGVIAVAGISTYDYVNESQKTNESAQILTQIYTNVRKLYIGQAVYAPDGAEDVGKNITERMYKAGAISSRYKLATNGTYANGPFGDITITTADTSKAVSSNSGTTPDGFKIKFKDLPETACNTLARQINPLTVRSLLAVSVNGTELKSKTDLTDSEIRDACAEKEKSTVIWMFK